jgi:histidine triad (HIT) family protein
MECIFCEIVAGRQPASVVYEDDAVLAFMDLIPITRGHLLVIPKEHHRNIFDTPPDLACRVMRTGAELAPALRVATRCDGMNLHISNEAAGGQVVWHLHLHLIPRYMGDGAGLRFPRDYGQRAQRAELDSMAELIRQAREAPRAG